MIDIGRGRPIPVCFIIDRLFPGGTESQLIKLLRNLDRSRIEPHLCLLDGEDPLSISLEPTGLPILRLGIKSLHHASTLKKAVFFRNYLIDNKIEIVQTYFFDSTYFGVAVARLARVRRIVRTRFMLDDLVPRIHRWPTRLTNRFVHGYIVNCDACRRSLARDERLDAAKIEIIPNEVDYERFANVPDLEVTCAKDRPYRVGMVGNLWPVKEPWHLLEAARILVPKYPRISFHLAGRGDLAEELDRRIRVGGLQGRVFLHGAVEDIPGFLANLDVAVLTSRSEGLPNAIIEYMAAGRAIVATSVGGTPELLDDGIHGRLIPPGDPVRLASAIAELAENPVLAAHMGRAARSRAKEHYSPQARSNRIMDFYRRLLDDPEGCSARSKFEPCGTRVE